MEELNQKREEDGERCEKKKNRRLSALNVEERDIMLLNVPQRKRKNKVMQVTWSDTKYCQSSEK